MPGRCQHMKRLECHVEKPVGLGFSLAPCRIWTLTLISFTTLDHSECSINNNAIIVFIITKVLSLLLIVFFCQTNRFKTSRHFPVSANSERLR